VVSGVCDGFIGNRMIEQYARQAGFLLDEGCPPWLVVEYTVSLHGGCLPCSSQSTIVHILLLEAASHLHQQRVLQPACLLFVAQITNILGTTPLSLF
jgi:hypothetical protein